MATRHPLPYAYAKAHSLLLEDNGSQLVLWAGDAVSPSVLSEVLRLYAVDALERELPFLGRVFGLEPRL